MEYIYKFLQYVPVFVVLYGLIMVWKHENARWFFITFGIIELIDELAIPFALNWNTHYYVYCMFMNVVFLFPVICRRRLAYWIYSKTRYEYFNQCYEKHNVAAQEMLIMCLVGVSLLLNMVSYVEVLLYKNDLVSSAFVKLYVRDNVTALLYIFMIATLLQYAFKAEFREGRFTDDYKTE